MSGNISRGTVFRSFVSLALLLLAGVYSAPSAGSNDITPLPDPVQAMALSTPTAWFPSRTPTCTPTMTYHSSLAMCGTVYDASTLEPVEGLVKVIFLARPPIWGEKIQSLRNGGSYYYWQNGKPGDTISVMFNAYGYRQAFKDYGIPQFHHDDCTMPASIYMQPDNGLGIAVYTDKLSYDKPGTCGPINIQAYVKAINYGTESVELSPQHGYIGRILLCEARWWGMFCECGTDPAKCPEKYQCPFGPLLTTITLNPGEQTEWWQTDMEADLEPGAYILKASINDGDIFSYSILNVYASMTPQSVDWTVQGNVRDASCGAGIHAASIDIVLSNGVYQVCSTTQSGEYRYACNAPDFDTKVEVYARASGYNPTYGSASGCPQVGKVINFLLQPIDGAPGDANRDGIVNMEDYRTIRNYFGQRRCGGGDANGDCFINGADYRTVRDNYGSSSN